MSFSELYLFLDISDPYDDLYRYNVIDDKVADRTKLFSPFYTTYSQKINDYLKSFITRNTTVTYFILINIKDYIFPISEEEINNYRNYMFNVNHQANRWTFDEAYFNREGYKGIELNKKYLNLLLDIIKKQNAKLNIVTYPWPGQIYRDDKNKKQSLIWKEWSKKNNVNFIDISKVFFLNERKSIQEREKFIDDHYLYQDLHFNERGHRLFFSELSKYLNF